MRQALSSILELVIKYFPDWIKDFFVKARKKSTERNAQSLTQAKQILNGLVKSETYLTNGKKSELLKIIGRMTCETKIPWYLFFDFELKNSVKETEERLHTLKLHIETHNKIVVDKLLKRYANFLVATIKKNELSLGAVKKSIARSDTYLIYKSRHVQSEYANGLIERTKFCWKEFLGGKMIGDMSKEDLNKFIHSTSENKHFRSFCESVKQFLAYVEGYNERFIKTRLKRHSYFFDGKDDSLGYALDEDQRIAVIKDDTHNLVIAAAGSGKTSVISARIAYLLRRKDSVNKDKILALAFTKMAAKEMECRLIKNYKIDLKVSTFHSVGRSIISEATKKPPKLLFDGENAEQQYQRIIQDIFDTCLKEPINQELLLECLSNFDEGANESTFAEKEEYYQYMQNKKYITLTGTVVKSVSERDIANFLFKHNIKFQYEPKAVWADNDGIHKGYHPDFYLPAYDCYIEHWGLSKDDKVPEWFSISSEEYLKKREWALAQFKKHGKRCIETWDYERTERQLIPNLKNKLRNLNRSINLKSLTYQELVEKTYGFKENCDEIVKQISTFISLAKSNFFKDSDIEERLHSGGYTPNQITFGKLANEVYRRYEAVLKKQERIDFNDMINQAIEIIKNNPNGYADKYDHILIDEFQDISNQRLELIRCFVNKDSKTKLFCVGDDWQSIYQFTGSEVRFFIDFGNYFEHPEITVLRKNYRCSKTIVDMSNLLISHNKRKINKEVKAVNNTEKKAFLYEIDVTENHFSASELQLAFNRMITHAFNVICGLLMAGEKQEDILVLSRFRRTVTSLKIKCGARKINGIRFNTVHSSKGSEAKHVIILEVISGTYGFPCEIKDSCILEPAKLNVSDNTFDEERRLFYVALTRSKRYLYIYTYKSRHSIFLDEIETYLEKQAQL